LRAVLCGAALMAVAPWACAAAPATAAAPWWLWPLALFVACFVMGIVAVPAGIGGGTLFVPIVSSFFPFHLDFVRGAGLLVALASALAAGPLLLRSGLASVRLALPLALVASLASLAGALLGLALPAQALYLMLGVVVLVIVVHMLLTGRSTVPPVERPDAWSRALDLRGAFVDGASGRTVAWRAHRIVPGMALFVLIGIVGGMFGIGAGWANVPVIHLLMGVPLKVAAGTSGLVLSLASSSAAWVYINHGAVLALVAVPSMLGMMLGARLGARLLDVLDARVVRRLVIGLLLFAGARALLKGLALWP
jgi:uncharacterized membrane protein YfcA